MGRRPRDPSGSVARIAALVVASVVAPCWELPSAGAAQELPARWARAPLTEVARAQVGADVASARFGVGGAGSTLCLVDTGLDASRYGDRVVASFDAFGAPTGDPREARFGGAVGGVVRDPHGHGTAMASIALAIAPDARLIVARAWDPAEAGFPDEAVVRAVRFCRAVAAEEEAIDARRLVILLSLGGHDGAHDGEGAFERALMAEAETPIVVAVGNDGARAVHAAGRVFAGETARVEVRVPRPAIDDARLALNVRFAPRSESAELSLVSGDGGRVGLAADGLHALGGLAVEVRSLPERPALRQLVLRPGAEAHTVWLDVGGPADFEVWLAGARLGPTFLPPALAGAWVRHDEQVSIPATARSLIAVGATVARAELGGRLADGASGDTASYSALGPSAAGAPKPDLVAPGGWIAAALSADLDPTDPENLVGGRVAPLADGRVAVRGTSPAAAVVAGALLLALELDPSTGPRARAHLVASARGEAWSPARGWGELDVARLLAHVRGRVHPPSRLVATRPLVPSDTTLWLSARVARGSLEIGVDGARALLSPSAGAIDLASPLARAPQVDRPVHIEAWLDGAPLEAFEVPVVPDRGPVPVRPRGGGACSASPAGAAGRRPLGLAVCLALSLRRLRRSRRPATTRAPRSRGPDVDGAGRGARPAPAGRREARRPRS